MTSSSDHPLSADEYLGLDRDALRSIIRDRDAEISRLGERLNERAKAENEHCKDCCCARSWAALGIASYTGRSIPEHITDLRVQLEAELKRRRDECND